MDVKQKSFVLKKYELKHLFFDNAIYLEHFGVAVTSLTVSAREIQVYKPRLKPSEVKMSVGESPRDLKRGGIVRRQRQYIESQNYC